MEKRLTKKDKDIWQRLVESPKEFYLASQSFLLDDVNRIALMREALYSQDNATAFYFLPYLKQEELMQLFDILVPLASTAHGSVGRVREAILSLSHDWVIARIERLAEPLLDKGTDDEYRRFLELYYELDKNLALRLAQRASLHSDRDIREAGEDFLELLQDGV